MIIFKWDFMVYMVYIYTYILAGGLEHFSFYDFAFSWEWNNHSN